MQTPTRILVVDDNPTNVDILEARLTAQGYEVVKAFDGAEALKVVAEKLPDLILLDIMMPEIDGIEVCRRIKHDDSLPFTPVIMVTAKGESKDVVEGLEAGAEEYLVKPVDHAALIARVASMLRIKALHDKTLEQSAQLEAWNRELEERVAAQVKELQKVEALKRFFPPQLADAIVSDDQAEILEDHRREVTVVFCDLRGFTVFSSLTEPEEEMRVLREYHSVVCPLIFEYGATLEHFAGDGVMSFLNDPFPCKDHIRRAIEMADAMRTRVNELRKQWVRREVELGFGIGIGTGFATLGRIGTPELFHYAAIGSVANLASRLCDEAKNEQILITQRAYSAIEEIFEVEPIGELSLKGFLKPVSTYNVLRLKNG